MTTSERLTARLVQSRDYATLRGNTRSTAAEKSCDNLCKTILGHEVWIQPEIMEHFNSN